MLRKFDQFRPMQVARHVKGYYKGRLYIKGIGALFFDHGKVSLPEEPEKQKLAAMKEINEAIKALHAAHAA
uniref:DUF1107 family protein n=1 Tax=Thaumasiovibrio occultus TaxID=1891184 RepID=UPI000B36439A|nr:DUF1107 family protein [Thaumasiovibrio occultus]